MTASSTKQAKTAAADAATDTTPKTAPKKSSVFSFAGSNDSFASSLKETAKLGCHVAAAMAPTLVLIAGVNIIASHLARRS